MKGLTPKRSHTSDEIISPAKSPRSYDPQTLKLLWGRAAGRCAMADCRIELFVAEPGHDPVCIIGEMGHVVASSDGGPRSNKTTRLDARDRYDNLILLCRNCHRKIDVLHESYPPERLHQIKNDHEAWVRTALPERGASAISWQVIRLQGDFPFDPTQQLLKRLPQTMPTAKRRLLFRLLAVRGMSFKMSFVDKSKQSLPEATPLVPELLSFPLLLSLPASIRATC